MNVVSRINIRTPSFNGEGAPPPENRERGTAHGSGLGVYRWVVERTSARLHGLRRLRVRWERRADMHEAFLKLACCLITHQQLKSPC